VTELTAGSEWERLAYGEAWTASYDRTQERQLAALIYSSSEAAEAFIAACALEARAILQWHADVAEALAAALLEKRTLDSAQIEETIASAIDARHFARARAPQALAGRDRQRQQLQD
jgi:ATP-dependent Zn protease